MSRGPQGQQGATQNLCLELWLTEAIWGPFLVSVFQGWAETIEGNGRCCGRRSCLFWLPSFPVLPLYIFQLTRGIYFGKSHLHFFFSHVQVKVLLPVLADVRA